jgi:hypothetical protein
MTSEITGAVSAAPLALSASQAEAILGLVRAGEQVSFVEVDARRGVATVYRWSVLGGASPLVAVLDRDAP